MSGWFPLLWEIRSLSYILAPRTETFPMKTFNKFKTPCMDFYLLSPPKKLGLFQFNLNTELTQLLTFESTPKCAECRDFTALGPIRVVWQTVDAILVFFMYPFEANI